MPINKHPWDLTPTEAISIQKELQKLLIIEKLNKNIKIIGGGDISFNKHSSEVYAGIVLLKYPEMIEIERSLIKTTVNFPYIPGLLSFREIPPLLKAWDKLKNQADIIILDGQGIAHPRRLGIASHFGILVNKPTIGCAKSRLIGHYDEPELTKGSHSFIYDKDEIIGSVLRTKDNVKPVFVSVGHKLNLDDAISVVINCTKKHKLPEPTRQAHLIVNALRRGEIKQT